MEEGSDVILIRMFLRLVKIINLIYSDTVFIYRPVAPVNTRFLDQSISATQSVSRNSEDHMESIQPIKYMLFILIFNKFVLYLNTVDCIYLFRIMNMKGINRCFVYVCKKGR
jgi:hypothetical protein